MHFEARLARHLARVRRSGPCAKRRVDRLIAHSADGEIHSRVIVQSHVPTVYCLGHDYLLLVTVVGFKFIELCVAT